MYKHFLFFECYKNSNDSRTIIKKPFSSLALTDNTTFEKIKKSDFAIATEVINILHKTNLQKRNF